ncbi:hypothetical protein AMTRI_Chr10g5740 [Amborella trichopoda]|uniref:pentatricopeptide repeat-containing protein At1g08070, chloroplastic-like n=1 Tax=Amborella trichopoda TaxID=13333 RepID=UPI0005D37E00|nr:pentatricopeptide repeat-containing protein At1g08070, chloroplastic-like [Amborella trichopoda]|eukprot:XP_011620953.1 pentatricopeptide repeat-containing protein At1g08070, chloroplastic-like [Amborella trichopoda]
MLACCSNPSWTLPSFPALSLLHICTTTKEFNQIHTPFVKTGLIKQDHVSTKLFSLYLTLHSDNLDHARRLFDQIQEPKSFAWNSILKAYINNHRSHEALVLYHNCLFHGVSPNKFTLPIVIKGCGRLSASEEGRQVHGHVLKMGFGFDIHTQSSLVDMYSKCGEICFAKKVFDRMVERDLISWNSMIAAFAKCGEMERAHKLFKEMPRKDVFSWTTLINGYAKIGSMTIAKALFDEIPEKNVVSWNTIISGYLKYGQIDSAFHLFNCMPERSLVSWNLMISGLEHSGHPKKALEVFDEMLKVRVRPNAATIVSALSAVSELALLNKGKWIHSYMDRLGFQISAVLATSLIEMYSKCGSIEIALEVFRSLPERRVGHWTAIIIGLAMHGLANHALKLFKEMRSVGLRPHALTFLGVLNACSHAGMVHEGRLYFEVMSHEYGIIPTIQHYGCMVDMLSRSGHLEEAKDVIERMPLQANEVIWMTLLSGCRKHGNIEIGEYAAKCVVELDPNATGCYVLLSNIYAAAGRWDDMAKVRETMRWRGVRKDPGRSLIDHGGVIHEFIVGDRSHPQTEEIYLKLDEMHERLKSIGYEPDKTQVLLHIEDSEKEVALSYHSEKLAIAFGLINLERGMPIRIVKNLRVCPDCHSATKLLSITYGCDIIVRDNSRFHHFKNGSCSCMDYW